MSQRPPFVYITHNPMRTNPVTGALEPRVDFTPAKAFGPFKFLLDWPEIRDMDLPTIYAKLQRRLRLYQPDDYLLLTGNPAICVIVALYMAEVYGSVRLMNWVAPGGKGRYEVTRIRIADIAKSVGDLTPEGPASNMDFTLSEHHAEITEKANLLPRGSYDQSAVASRRARPLCTPGTPAAEDDE